MISIGAHLNRLSRKYVYEKRNEGIERDLYIVRIFRDGNAETYL